MPNVSPLVTCDRSRQYLFSAPSAEERPAVIEQHLQSCPSCRNVASTLANLESVMRRAYATEVPPAGLWDRIAQRLDAEDVDVAGTKGRLPAPGNWITKSLERARYRLMPPRWRPAVVLAAIALIVVVAIAADPFALRKADTVNALVREPVNDLITYRVSHRPLDFESGDPRTISEWWADKLDFRAPMPVAELGGYRLIGGRLCYFLNRRLTALMYRNDDHVVSLYVMSSEQLELPRSGNRRIDGWKVSVHGHKGYTSLIWKDESLAFALVGDLSSEELLRVAKDLRRSWSRSRDTRLLRARITAVESRSMVSAHDEGGRS